VPARVLLAQLPLRFRRVLRHRNPLSAI
jgi:hypothetical protein